MFDVWRAGFVTAAVAATLLMAVYLYYPQTVKNPYYSESYVEALAASRTSETADFMEAVYYEPSEPAGQL